MNTVQEEIGNRKKMNDNSFDDSCLKPKCPYYQDSKSNLACPYFMMANYGQMANGNGKSNWAGLTSMILGIITISMCWLSLFSVFTFIFIIMSVLTIIFGGVGIGISQRTRTGKASSIAGLTLGIISIVITLLFFLLMMSMRYYY